VKSILKTSLAIFMALTNSAYALNPVQGWYGGIFIGGSYSPAIDFSVVDFTQFFSTTTPLPSSAIPLTKVSGSLKYSGFGNIGGQFGYRMDQFRLEGEFVYNSSPYHEITIGDYTFVAKKSGKGFRYNGNTNTAALFFNGFWDIYCLWPQSNAVPYLGLGIGYSNIQDTFKLYYEGTQVTNGKTTHKTQLLDKQTSSANLAIGQAIAGLSYFMDDYTTFGLDFRYFQTTKKTYTNPLINVNTSASSASINLIFNGMFDFG